MEQDALRDRDALEATGDLAAAESALDKLGADSAFPQATPAPSLYGSSAAKMEQGAALLASARLGMRRVALRKTARDLGLAAAPEGSPRP